MVITGVDTVGRALVNLFYRLSVNPDWLLRVREEIDSGDAHNSVIAEVIGPREPYSIHRCHQRDLKDKQLDYAATSNVGAGGGQS
jgi:hypothetical protein